MTATLITISFSHYCEKARWALDRCGVQYVEESHLPVFHYLATYRNKAKRSVPVLVDGKTVVRDSSDIIAWADKHRPGSLIPISGAEDALAIEDDLDNHFGPATRRWAYFHLLPTRDADPYLVEGAPRWQRTLLKLSRPVAVAYLRRSLKIDEAGVQRSLVKIEDIGRLQVAMDNAALVRGRHCKDDLLRQG
jgi:glutathione S-transferase